jgi:hypothetical protein
MESGVLVPAPDAEVPMETVVPLGEKLLERAKRVTAIEEKDEVSREALTALIERKAARRMIDLAGSEPDLVAPPRRRSNPA